MEFMEYCVSAVVGRQLFKQLKTKRAISKYVEVSDEAFALLLVENSWDRWCQMYTEGDMTIQTKIHTKYTKTMKGFHKKTNTPKKFGGWSREGLKRYNELYALVAKD